MNPNGTLGGAERALLDLMHAVRQARPEWVLKLLTSSEGEFTAAARAMGMSVFVLPFPAAFSRLGDAGAGGPAGDEISRSTALVRLSLVAPQLAAYVWKLRRFIRAHRPDLIHSNGFKTHILATWAATHRSKVIWHIHDYVRSRPLMSRLMRIHGRRCDAAITNSNSVACDLDSLCRGRLKIHTIHNAVDLDGFNPRGPALDLDALSGLPPAPEGTLRVGLVATMARWKGHEVFLRALSMLPNELPIRGYVIGGPIYATAGSQYSIDELGELAREVRIEQRVGFTGYIKDPAAAMRALDVVVHASTQPEPFGLVVAEAMACGKPVVASSDGGVSEIISENENALCHQPGDTGAMAACIARLAADRALRKRLGAKGRCSAEKQFDRSRLARDVVSVYDSLLATRN